MTMWNPSNTEYAWDDKLVPHYFRTHRAQWLNISDWYMSDAVPLPAPCHEYWYVESGQKCHKCGKRVVGANGGGVACPCKHTWFCA